MKKILLILLAAATAYAGAMHRYMPLMALAAAELVLLAGMGLLSRYLIKRADAEFVKKSDETEAGGLLSCAVILHRRGRLPGGRLRLCLTLCYEGEKLPDREYLWAGSGRGGEHLDFTLRAARCGLVSVRLEQLRIFDYLSLFHPEKELSGEMTEMTVAVFPGETVLDSELTALTQGQSGLEREQYRSLPGESYNEIRQIRGYLPGDPVRRIHWNQSARTDSLWIREYESESEGRAILWLDGTAKEREKGKAADPFYRLVSALTRGLIRQGTAVRVIWQDRLTDQRMWMDVCAGTQVRELLYRLYRCEPAPLQTGGHMEEAEAEGNMSFSLDMDLGWYCGGRLIRRFTAEELEERPVEREREERGGKMWKKKR